MSTETGLAPIYSCSHCGKRHASISASFDHNCALRPRPTRAEVDAALAEVTPRYLAADAEVSDLPDGQFLVRINAEAAARFEGASRARGTAANRVGDPLLKRGYRLIQQRGGITVY